MESEDPALILEKLALVFTMRVREYGDTPAGVLWKNSEGQELRFQVLSRILAGLPSSLPITIADMGCGYGAFFDLLTAKTHLPPFTYTGYDIAPEMVMRALQRIDDGRADFHVADNLLKPADFTFVSGTYNLHIDTRANTWNAFVKNSLVRLWARTSQGLAFNMLDKNHPHKLDGLYYADRDDFLGFCHKLSPDVTLIDDYSLDEWTIFIRR